MTIGGRDGAPAYDSGQVYTADMYGISSFNAANGELNWLYRYYDGPKFNDYLYAFHKATGTVRWKKLLLKGNAYSGRDSLSQPAILNDRILVASRKWLECIDRTNVFNCRSLVIVSMLTTCSRLFFNRLYRFSSLMAFRTLPVCPS